MPLDKVLFFNKTFFSPISGTNSLNFTTYSQSTLPTEIRNEGKYNHHRERSFISKFVPNMDRILTEYAAPINKDYLNGGWYAPENIIVVAPPTCSPHVSDFILHIAEQHLAKVVTFGIAKGNENADPASFISLAPAGPDIPHSSILLKEINRSLTLPHGQMLHFPLTQLYSIARDSFIQPSALANIHPDSVLPLTPFTSLTQPSPERLRSFFAPFKPFFDTHRSWERKQERCTRSDVEQRDYGIHSHP